MGKQVAAPNTTNYSGILLLKVTEAPLNC